MSSENELTSISEARSAEEVSAFWDDHDFTDFDTEAKDVPFEVVYAVPVEVELFNELDRRARKHGVNVETLVNMWLQQKLAEHG